MSHRDRIRKTVPSLVVLMLIAAVAFPAPGSAAETKGTKAAAQKVFASPDEAATALADAMRSEDEAKVVAVLGPGSASLVRSGDPVVDRTARERFIKSFEEAHKVEETSAGRAVLAVGKEKWPLPIPIVKKGSGWVFDTAEGKKEILNRRIGENELSTIQVMRAIVDAQREYAMEDRDGDAILEYAQTFRSDQGKRNGLYWETKEGEEPSPLGPLAARARAEGYTKKEGGGGPVPYHGYLFRMLKAQGKDAPGGAYDYVAKGEMIGGFAAVAYPAKYGASGVMTFMVNHEGVVYEKNLGPGTEKAAKAMKRFDPGKGWRKVE